MSESKKPLFSVGDFYAIGQRAFTQGDARPEGTNWQAKAKQKGYDEAKASYEARAADHLHDDLKAEEKPMESPAEAPTVAVSSVAGVVASVDQLIAQKQAIESALQAEKQKAIESIQAIISEYGFTRADIFGNTPDTGAKPRRSTFGQKVAPKYRDHATGATWTGRGKAPVWIAGKDRTQYLIQS